LNTFAYAQNLPKLRAGYPESYTVVKGDVLSRAVIVFFESPVLWNTVLQDPSQISNPDLIYPGDEFRLIFNNQQPQLVFTPATPNSRIPTSSNANTAVNIPPLKIVKLKPKVYVSETTPLTPTTALTPTTPLTPPIPLQRIKAFLSRNHIIDVDTFNKGPHVIAGQDNRLILADGDSLYARGVFPDNINSYGLYRKGIYYRDPETNAILGIQAVNIGVVNLHSVTEGVGKFIVTSSSSDISLNDRILALPKRDLSLSIQPKPLHHATSGIVINIEYGMSHAGKFDIIAINLGKQDRIMQGHILNIYNHNKKVRSHFTQSKINKSVVLPSERIGSALVVHVFDKMSLAIILDSKDNVMVNDLIGNP
jgi:hypothetical protein